MRFGIGLLKQWEPSFVLIATGGKVQGLGASLIGFLVLFFVQIVDSDFIEIRSVQIELVINDALFPLAI